MNKSRILIFLLILIADLVAVLMKSKAAEIIFKPLLCFSLLLIFYSGTNYTSWRRKYPVMLALGFSLAGDVLLLFAGTEPNYFLSGLVSFLIAHIFYIIFFNAIRSSEKQKLRILLLIPVVLYYAALVSVLFPYLKEMLVPVLIYGMVISLMLWLALHMQYVENPGAGRLMMWGAILFVLSDSILAFNKFYQSFELAGFLVMLTYGLAQLLIISGALQYLNSVYKE